MNVEFSSKFKKEFQRLDKQESLSKALYEAVENVIAATSIQDVKNIKKLSGFKGYYRIRIGNYRVGLKLEDETVIFAAFSHRKDIYKNFP